ncbi:valine--tRNA ligase [Bacteroidota bacterium]
MELNKNYDPSQIEDKWYAHWMKKNYFHSEPNDRESYCIVIPPPNVTGVLHMGHMLNNTIQDVLVRHARMEGKNACWVPGTDHASIATESKVVALLKEKGIDKNKISREKFIEYAWEWKEKHGGIILEQLKKLGASCDWERTAFTMDSTLSESVIHVFVDLYNKGNIYRGIRMVNWDPQAKTAVSDEEVVYKELQSRLYYVDYQIEDTQNTLTIATTRPETILGDTAVCVHPEDERYLHLKGKRVIVPMVNRSVPLIFDDYVDREFGTGALKITPAHDINDYELGIKYNLPSIDIFNEDGTLSEKAELFIGIDRFEARKMVVRELEKSGALTKVEDYINKIGFSERTDAVIEPRISTQWFVKMDQLAIPALEHVLNNDIHFFPAKFKNMYNHWMENVKDWCISRQLWWGHRIPAWYGPDGQYVVAKNEEEALTLYHAQHPGSTISELRQDEDVLDTWFSSWLWPISTFNGILDPENKDIKYYYPTNDLVTAPEIIFFWVARMIIAGYEYLGDKPFKNVYFTGIVRDKQRRKMSKSLGNSPDPIELMKKYGADGVRVGMLLSSPAGNDLLFDEGLCEQGRNFNNKIWNAFRLVKSWNVDDTRKQDASSALAVKWIDARINQNLQIIEDHYSKYRMSDILMNMYKLFWDDFSGWYLEIVKPTFGEAIDAKTYESTIGIFEKLLKILHPFIPFITEELWHQLADRKQDEDIIISDFPKSGAFNEQLIKDFDHATEVISAIRDFRSSSSIPNKESIVLQIKADDKSNSEFDEIAKKLCYIEQIEYVTSKPENVNSFIIRSTEYFIPLNQEINLEEELEKSEKELNYYQGFLKTVNNKLENDKFVNNAPKQVVALEQKKKEDAELKIQLLKEKLAKLKER